MVFPSARNLYGVAIGTGPTRPTITEPRNPTPNDLDYEVYQTWVNSITKVPWVLLSFSITGSVVQANWETFAESGLLLVVLPPGNYTANDEDQFIGMSSSSATTLTLPSTPTTGRIIYVKDFTGMASTNNIAINGGPYEIDGSSTYVLKSNYASVTLIFTGVNWSIT